MATTTIRWEVARDGVPTVTYYVDDAPVGTDDDGFDRVLELVGSRQGDVTLRIRALAGGGVDLEDSLPFRDRLGELRAQLGGSRLTYAIL